MADKFVFEAETLLTGNFSEYEAQFQAFLARIGAMARQTIASPSGARGLAPSLAAGEGQSIANIRQVATTAGLNPAQIESAVNQAKAGFTSLYEALTQYATTLRTAAGNPRSFTPFTEQERDAIARRYEQATQQASAPRIDTSKVTQDARIKADQAEAQAADPAVREAKLRLAIANQQAAAEVKAGAAEAAVGDTAIRESKVREAVARDKLAALVKADAAEEAAANKEIIAAKARAIVAEREQSVAVRQQVAQLSGAGQGTLFQRVQSFVAQRQGTGQAERLPTEFQTFGQFFTSKALTTAGFALSGGAIYAAVSGFREIIREASELQRQLAVVKGQFDALGNTEGFERFSKQVVQIAVDTGVVADESALVARQLSGVFRTPAGLPDFNRALNETKDALKLQQVTGLPTQEITDSLTALATTFGISFKQIGDSAIGLEQQFGVLSPQIITFAADLAPVAKELGFSYEQIAALGAIAQQRSGVSGSSLAESFNRALPALKNQAASISELLNQNKDTAQYTQPILDAFSQGNGAGVLEQLTAAYAHLTQAQRDSLAEFLGGQRNAKAFFAVLQGGQQTINALNDANPGQFAGDLDKRFKDFTDTVEFAFEHAKRALEQFGLALFDAGIADALKDIATVGLFLATVLSRLIEVFGGINQALGGLPAKILAVYVAFKAISALRTTAAGFGNFVGGITGRTAGGAAAAVTEGEIAGSFVAGGVTYYGADAESRAKEAAQKGVKGLGVTTRQKLGAAASNLFTNLGVALAAFSVSEAVQRAQEYGERIAKAESDLSDQVTKAIQQGANPEVLLAKAKEAAAGANKAPVQGDTYKIPNSLLDKAFNSPEGLLTGFGTIGQIAGLFSGTGGFLSDFLGQGPDPLDPVKQGIQKARSDKQIAQLQAIVKELNGHDDAELKKLINDLSNDPGNYEAGNRAAVIIGGAQSVGPPALLKGLLGRFPSFAGSLSDRIRQAVQQAGKDADDLTNALQTGQKAVSLEPSIDQLKAQYQAGEGSLADYEAALRTSIAFLKQALQNKNLPADIEKQFLDLLNQQQPELTKLITDTANQAATIQTRLSSFRGSSTADAVRIAAQHLSALQATGFTDPDTQNQELNAALDELDGLQKQEQDRINALVEGSGGLREPTALEKLARARQGISVPSELRQTIVSLSLQITQADNLKAVAAASGTSTDKIVDDVTRLIVLGDETAFDTLATLLQHELDTLKKTAAAGGAFGFIAADPHIAQKEQEIQTAIDDLNSLKASASSFDPGATGGGGDNTALQQQAQLEAANEARALQQALVARQRSEANGDPIAEANAAISAAQLAIQQAQQPSEYEAAINQLIEAQNQLVDAQAQALDAQLSLQAAAQENSGNVIGAAQTRLDLANQQVAQAHGAAAQANAIAQQIAAQKAVRQAIEQVFDSQQDLVAAIANAAGDQVAAAKAALAKAQKAVDDLIAAGRTSADDPELNAAKATLVGAQAQVRDSELQTKERDIDFALQIGRITTKQAIAQLQGLLTLVAGNEQETQEILLKIHDLQNQLNQDYQFNIPTGVQVPTLYEVRRLQASTAPGGPGSYNDNRQVSFDITVNNQGDLNNAVDTIVAAVTAPPRGGTTPGAY